MFRSLIRTARLLKLIRRGAKPLAALTLTAACLGLSLPASAADVPPTINLNIAPVVTPAPAPALHHPGTDVPGSLVGAPLSAADIYQQTLHSTVFIVTYKDGKPYLCGTGWVLDRERRLVITNHHVAGTEETVGIFFPTYDHDRLITEIEYYLDMAKPTMARVIDSDSLRDLAVIQVDSLPADVRAVKLARRPARPGEQVHSIGNPVESASAAWVYSHGSVRQTRHMQLNYDSGQHVEATILEAESPTNHGDSGGPVVNDRGELVAVVASGKSPEQGINLMTFFIDLSEVKAYVAQFGPLLDPQTADAFAKRAENYLNKGRLARAVDDFTAAIKLDPQDSRLFIGRANAESKLGQFDKVVEDATAAIRLDANSAAAFNARGWAFEKKADHDTALADFNEALKLDPKLAKAFHGRALTYRASGKDDLALADFTTAIRLDPTDADVYNERGILHDDKKELDKALADYSEAIRIRPSDDVLYSNRASVADRKNDENQAIADLNTAFQLNPNNADYVNRRGVEFFKLNQFESALADFNKAVEMNPQSALYLNNRGNTLGKLGQLDRARQDYAAALRIDPKSADQQTFAKKAPQNNAPKNNGQPQGNGRQLANNAPTPPAADPNENQGQEEQNKAAVPQALVGRWSATLPLPNGGHAHLIFVLNADGSCKTFVTDHAGNIVRQDHGQAVVENQLITLKSVTGAWEQGAFQLSQNRLVYGILRTSTGQNTGLVFNFERA